MQSRGKGPWYKMHPPLRPAVVILLLVTCLQLTWTSEGPCKKREKSLASLKMAKESISKAKELYPNCTKNNSSQIHPGCGTREKSFGYLDVTENLINYALQNYPTCSDAFDDKTLDPENKNKSLRYERAEDCSQVMENGYNTSGIYTIWLKSANKSLQVFCDMLGASGGWTVIQRRGNFPVQENFFRDWSDYKKGFGNITRDFWIGNDNLFALTNQASYSIRFDLEHPSGSKAHALYKKFRIDGEPSRYELHIDGYSGDAGDRMIPDHNGKGFYTKDRDTSNTCSQSFKGGWWYGSGRDYACYGANLNGEYGGYLKWLKWKNDDNLKAVQMKLKRM